MDYGRIWRMAKTPVILLFLLLFVILAGRWGYNAMTAPLPPPYVPPCVERPVPDGKLKSEMVSVRVFNASNQRGKAAEVSQQLKRQGFNVVATGNAEQNQDKSVIIGQATDAPEVELVAKQFGELERIADGRHDRSVEVRIGSDYESMVADAPVEIEIEGDTICLPAPPTAAPA